MLKTSNMDDKDNFQDPHNYDLPPSPTASDLPCTPLERGVKNYYPEGVKVRKENSPLSLLRSFHGSMNTPTHSPELLRLQDLAPKRSFHQNSHDYQRYGQDANTISSLARLTSYENLTSKENQRAVFSKSFHLEQIKKDIFGDLKHNKLLHSSPTSVRSRNNSQTDNQNQMRCESVETFFPDIFSVPSFYDRPLSAKSVASDIISRDDVIKRHPSQDSVFPSSPTSESKDNQVLSTESSAYGESNSSASDHEPSNDFGFKVHVRIKPLEDQDADATSSSRLRSVQVKGEQSLVLCTRPSLRRENTGSNHSFKFDHVLDESASQKDTYDVTTQPLVEMTLEGYHSCLIAYGSPGSGKSHALFGKASSGKYKGLIIRAAEALMASIDKSGKSETKTEVSMSFIQIYNEKLYDILDPSATDNIKFHDVGDVHSLEGVTEWPIETTEDVTKQLRRNPNRLRDAGRSHTIFTLRFRKEEVFEQDEEAATKSFRTIAGRMDFVDLVGVNRSTKHSTHDSTGNNATAKANRSLQVFGNVILALTDSKNSSSPPYRDSRLTRMLREALGGNCVTRLLVTTSACPNSAHETLNCLTFAKRAMSLKNFPAPYVSVEKIKEKQIDAIPADDKAASSEATSEHECITVTTKEQLRNNDNDTVTTTTRSTVVQDQSALPPIQQNSTDNGAPVKLSVTNETNSAVLEASATESEKAAQKLSRRRRVSKDYSEADATDGKRKNDRARKSRRKSRTKALDASVSNSQSNWQAEPDYGSAGNVVTLPQIATPDILRHQGNCSAEVISQEGKVRRKKQVDTATMREHDAIKRFKERPSSSHGHSSLKDGGSLIRSLGNMESNERKEAFTGVTSASQEQIFKLSNESTDCCLNCQVREEKIKRDYDRMILFSKKDRDLKQSRIEELEVLLSKARNESAPLAEIQKLTEEKVKDHQALKKQKELTETFRAQLSTMVCGNEWKKLQELHQSDAIEIEQLKKQIASLQKDLNDQTNGASKLLAKKSEQIAECETEIAILRKKASKTEVVSQSEFDELQASFNRLKAEKERDVSVHHDAVKEITFKLTCSQAQVSQMQEAKVEIEKQFDLDKESMQRDISILTKQVAELSKSKKKQEFLKNLPLKCDSATNTEDLRSKLNGLAYTVHCLRCAAQRFVEDNDCDSAPSLQDAELRILLLQDTKNRELLLQLKRERNLLRDVMKIMYCRQWFTEEGNPHVKRTLRKVGIDLKELALMQKPDSHSAR